jgi:2-oxoisovalerate dehydrogenase E1 component beta subunit
MTTTMVQALNDALRASMEENDRVLVMGEDVGELGGVFRVTEGLQKDFGPDRVMNSLLAESSIVGSAIGLAMRGYRPVCEIQFDGFVYPAFNQIVSQLAKLHARTRGRVRVPVVIRIPVGGGIGAVEHHSESNEAYFTHTAGLRVVCCSDPNDAHWMLRDAIASDDPVIFYEPKRRYWSKGEVSANTDRLPLNRARIVRPGRDLTLITYGGMVQECLAAAEAAEDDGHSLEVLDLRSLSPLDTVAVVESVRRTTRAVVVHEAPTYVSLGSEIAARIQEECFYHLEAPVLRVGGHNTPYPPAKLEDQFLPDLDRLLDAVDRSLAY